MQALNVYKTLILDVIETDFHTLSLLYKLQFSLLFCHGNY